MHTWRTATNVGTRPFDWVSYHARRRKFLRRLLPGPTWYYIGLSHWISDSMEVCSIKHKELVGKSAILSQNLSGCCRYPATISPFLGKLIKSWLVWNEKLNLPLPRRLHKAWPMQYRSIPRRRLSYCRRFSGKLRLLHRSRLTSVLSSLSTRFLRFTLLLLSLQRTADCGNNQNLPWEPCNGQVSPGNPIASCFVSSFVVCK